MRLATLFAALVLCAGAEERVFQSGTATITVSTAEFLPAWMGPDISYVSVCGAGTHSSIPILVYTSSEWPSIYRIPQTAPGCFSTVIPVNIDKIVFVRIELSREPRRGM